VKSVVAESYQTIRQGNLTTDDTDGTDQENRETGKSGNRETSEGLAGYPNIPSLAALRLCARPSGHQRFHFSRKDAKHAKVNQST
jgi:hypothetical protein